MTKEMIKIMNNELLKDLMDAAEQGQPKAQFKLGVGYKCGSGVKKDYEKAVYWFRKAAEQGHAPAKCNLGWMYSHGSGVKKDLEKAVDWFREAADQGFAQAQCNLGVMYDYGYGVKKDLEKAVSWYRKAADQGRRNAVGPQIINSTMLGQFLNESGDFIEDSTDNFNLIEETKND